MNSIQALRWLDLKFRFRYLLVACITLPFIFIVITDVAVQLKLHQTEKTIQNVDKTANITPNIIRLDTYLSRMERSVFTYTLINGEQSIQHGYPLTTYIRTKSLAHEVLNLIVKEQVFLNTQIVNSDYLKLKMSRMEDYCEDIVKLVNSGKQKEAIDLINQGDLIRFGQSNDLDIDAVLEKDLETRHSINKELIENLMAVVNFTNYGVLLAIIFGAGISGWVLHKLIGRINSYTTKITKTVLDIGGVVGVNKDITKNLHESVVGTGVAIKEIVSSAEQLLGKAKQVVEMSANAKNTSALNMDLMLVSQNEMLALEGNIDSSSKKLIALDLELNKIKSFAYNIKELSDESDLLSLNALIQASSAGSFGDGFSVIAHELQALALQIKELTTEVEQAALHVQISMNEIKLVSDGNLMSGKRTAESLFKAGAAFENIKSVSEDVYINMADLLKYNSSQVTVLEQMDVAMKSIGNFSTSVDIGSNQTNESIKALAVVVEDLNKLI